MKIPTCLCARLRRGGPEAARRSGQSSTARAGDRLSTIVRALLNGLKVLSRAALFRSPGYVAGLRRKRFRSARRRRANFDVRPIVDEWTHAAVGNVDADLLEKEVLGMRYCDPSQMTAVALRNPVDEDDERLEYLVSGRFGSGPDDRGFHSVAWVFHGDLLDHAGADTVKAAIQEYCGTR